MRYEVEQGNILMYSPYLWRVVLASESGERKTVAMCEKREHAEMLAESLNLDESLKNEWPGKIQFMPMPEVATLRDQFAMSTLSGWLASYGPDSDIPSQEARTRLASQCYAFADALLEARK